MVAVAFVTGLVLALILQTEGSSPERDPGSRPRASLSGADIARIAKRVERIRRLRFTRPVQPLFLDRAKAGALLNAATRRSPGRLRSDEEALELLGLMRPGESLAKALVAVGKEQILGFYDDRRKRLVVVRDETAGRPLLEITLAHELVHALEDQRFGLRERGGADDASLAESALAEGTATDVMLEYARRYFGAGDALSLLASASRTTTKLPAYVEQSLLFPYEAGLRFVEALRGGSGSWRAVDMVLRGRRPRSAEQILHPEKYVADERPVAVAVPDVGRALGSDWRRVGVSSVGEFDLRALFEIVGRDPDEAAAAGWGGGQFALWRKGGFEGSPCAAPCIARDVGAMRIAWDSGTDRAVAGEALGRSFEKGLGARRLSGAAGVELWSSRGGVIGLASAGTETDVVLAPTPSLAAAALERLTAERT